MKIKNTIKKTVTAFLALALTLGATGCNFLVTDNQKDLKRTVATVDITDALEDKKGETLAGEFDKIVDAGGLVTDIPKRDLVASFLTQGYTYVNNYGYTYKDTFNLLMDGLVSDKVLAQYAVAYFLEKDSALTADKCVSYINTEIGKATGKEKALLEANKEVLTMKYFLTQGTDGDINDYHEAVYNLRKSFNNSLDSAENTYIVASSSEHTHTESRTMPTNVNATDEEYLPLKDGVLDYKIYTGRNTPDSCGEYKKLEGSTATSRKRAYNAFLANLDGYGLIGEDEDRTNITELNYYYMELARMLSNKLVEKYAEELKDQATAMLTPEQVAKKYDSIKKSQKEAYEENATAFDTALDKVSNDSFVLYGQKDFGFVYNILIPFSAAQNEDYSAAKSKFGKDEDAIYNARKAILEDVQAKDLRSAWFCADNEDEHYAFETTEISYFNNNGDAADYLFFKDNFTNNAKYKKLTQYAGAYPYKGTAVVKDGEYDFTPIKMDIDGFIDEMEEYIDFVVGKDEVAKGGKLTAYGDKQYDTTYVDTVTNKTDFSKFMYYSGKVTLQNTARSDYFNAKVGKTNTDNDSYKALSAINELMFAYSTDTGCLNTYMGYVVSPYKTEFVSEFEYAAQYVVKQGVGSYVVAPSDYGWHIMYCSFVYDADDGDVYGGFKTDEMEVEGTFSYLFYESLKATSATSYTTTVKADIVNGYKNDKAVTLYTEAYEDLLELDKK